MTLFEIYQSIITPIIIYGVSATFFYPAVVGYFLWKVDQRLGGGCFAHLVSIGSVILYLFSSYWGRPEKKYGRAWLALNKWWPISHGYFPVKLWVWDGEKCVCQPSAAHKKAIPATYFLALHPHGPFPLSASVLMPQLAKFGHTLGDMFQKVRFAAANAVFIPPIARDMYLSLGCIEANRKTLLKCVEAGHPIAIFPGGEHEQLLVCLDDSPFEDVIEPTDGLLKIAIATQTPIVPAFSFGERRAYHSSTFLLPLRQALVRKFRIGIPCAWGRHIWFPFVPRSVAVNIVIGKPIDLPLLEKGNIGTQDSVRPEAISELRKAYIKEMTQLYDNFKHLDDVASKKTLRWIPVNNHKAKAK